MTKKIEIINTLKKPLPRNLFLATVLVMFGGNYYVMATFPGNKDFMCLPGANLTAPNILFALTLSIMTGLLIAGFVRLFKLRSSRHKTTIKSLTGLGVLIGIFTTFCTLCTIPIITLFGASISLGFFTDYSSELKVISLIFMSLALYFLNKQLNNECDWCVE